MDRLTRKELKTDKFAAEVGHTVEFLEEHRKQAIIVGAAVLIIIVAVVGSYYYNKQQHAERQQALRDALRTYQAQISDTSSPFIVTFPTLEEKEAAVQKAFKDVITKYPGSDEATVATFYLGIDAATNGDYELAVKLLKEAADSGNQPYASQAAYSLAGIYEGQGKLDEAEKIYRDLMKHPTVLVSKEQATISLARMIAKKDPAKARAMLEPLRTERSAVSRAALTALGEIARNEKNK